MRFANFVKVVAVTLSYLQEIIQPVLNFLYIYNTSVSPFLQNEFLSGEVILSVKHWRDSYVLSSARALQNTGGTLSYIAR